MLPAYEPGDHVLTFNWRRSRAGDVVVFKSKGRFYIKRVDKIVDGLFYISGDNKKESSQIGPIDGRQTIGKVIWKY